MYINTVQETSNVAKYIPKVSVNDPPLLPQQLKSMERQVLQQAYKVVLDKPRTLFPITFAPKWVVYKLVQSEKYKYLTYGACKEVTLSSLPYGTNITYSHYIFVLKYTGKWIHLKLKCRPVSSKTKYEMTPPSFNSPSSIPLGIFQSCAI